MAEHWGGPWTEQKLSIVQKYIKAYLTALKNQPFNKIYVDAFAGKGYRYIEADQSEFFFGQKVRNRQSGSPRIALEESAVSDRPFNKFIFIELDKRNSEELHTLKGDFSKFSDKIDIINGDANEHLLYLCSKQDWKNTRALLFLDPYGMAVRWETLEVIAATRAIDLWLLFPLGVAINRLLKKSGTICDKNREKLNRIFGTHSWFDAFYKSVDYSSLFGEGTKALRKRAGFDEIADFFTGRLRTIVPSNGICPPRSLRNKKNVPIFLLYFVCTNPNLKAIRTATGIANGVLKSQR